MQTSRDIAEFGRITLCSFSAVLFATLKSLHSIRFFKNKGNLQTIVLYIVVYMQYTCSVCILALNSSENEKSGLRPSYLQLCLRTIIHMSNPIANACIPCYPRLKTSAVPLVTCYYLFGN